MNRPLPALLLVAMLSATGCVGATYSVQVNGYTEDRIQAPWAPGAAFCVVENRDAKNPLLEREIKAKAEQLLSQRGFRLVPASQAAYFLAFTYGLGPAANVPWSYPDYAANIGFGIGGGYWGPSFFLWPGFASYPSRPQSWYDRWLLLNVFEAKTFREKGERRTLWVGEARSSGASGDLRQAVNPLLFAAFARFGQNTGQAVTVEVDSQELRYRELEQAR
ncbi:MAG: DUF4136 domain-containing protein [Deltaproteobacteria bacterium]|nr:DUF4136 domain-containing protein [Deltaproteobacteria bacterium]